MGTLKQKPVKLSSSTKVSSISSWSLALNAFFYSIVIGIIWNVVVLVAWQALDRAGAFTKLDSILVSMAGEEATKVSEYLGLERVMGVSVVLSISFIASIPLFALISGVIYNAISRMTGGISITMTSKVFKDLATEAQALEDSIPVKETLPKPGRRASKDALANPTAPSKNSQADMTEAIPVVENEPSTPGKRMLK